MIVATFNVNSVRARIPVLLKWLEDASPDVVVLQETKVEDGKFPFADLEPAGYEIKIHGQKRYNGVAILSKKPIESVESGLGGDWPVDCRVIRAVVDGVQIVNTYVPNGNEVGNEKWEYKMKWLDHFPQFLADSLDMNQPAIWLGDINVAPTPQDVYESEKKLGNVGHHPDEFSKLAKIVEQGWTDCFRKLTPEGEHYTFWDFRIPNAYDRNLGWRIDHIYVNEPLVEKCTRCWVDGDPRMMERPSDHTPLLAEFSI